MTVAIVPATGGFGEYQRGLGTEKRVKSLREAAGIYSDGTTSTAIPASELESGADIRGKIHDEPERVYAIEDEHGGYIYFGVA